MFRFHGVLLRIVFVTLAAIVAFGATQQAQAQAGQICRDEGELTICGDEFRDFKADLGIDGYELTGNLTIAPKGGAPYWRVSDASAVPADHKLKRATFQHVDDFQKSPYGFKDILFGDISFVDDPRQRVPFGSGSTVHEGNTFVGVLWVDVQEQFIYTPLSSENEDVPIYPIEIMTQQNLLYNQAYLDHLALSAMFADDSTNEERSDFYVEFRMGEGEFPFLGEIAIPRLRLAANAENPKLPFSMRITMDEKGNYSGTASGFKLQMAGMTGEAKGIVVKEGEFEAASFEFSRADNPNMPNLDPSNPNLVFKLEGLKYKDGHFAVGASVGIKDWQVGNAFKLSKQSFGLVVDDVLKTTTIVISSTLSFPFGSAMRDSRQYPMSIRIGAQKLGEGFYTFGKGTLLNNNEPNLALGPLSFGLPTSTSLNIDSRKNFMGLEVDKVKLTWNADFGGKSGIQSSFRLGIDQERNLVFSVNGGTLNVPEIRTGALVTTLAGKVTTVDNATTVTLKGTARLNIPGNSAVAPTVELNLRGGKGVCSFHFCSKKTYELKMSAFELKIAGFSLGLSQPRGTADGGFAVHEASLKVPSGITSISGKVNGLTITGKGDVSVTGGAFELPPLQIGKISFVGVKGSFVKAGTGGYEFRGAGVMPLPGLDPSGGASGKKITVDLAVRTTNTGNFSGMGVKVQFNTGVPGIPIGGTGMELLAIGGTFDLTNNTAKIGVSMRAGTSARVGPLPIATINAKSELQINPFKFTANGELSILIFKVADASLGVGAGQGFNSGPGFNVNFNVNAVVVHGQTSLRVGQVIVNGKKDTRIAAQSEWALGIKKGQFGRLLPPRNLFLQEVRFKGGHFLLKDGSETIGLMTTVGCCFFFKASVFVDLRDGVDVSFVNAKNYKLIDSAQVRAQAAAQASGFVSQQVSAASVLGPETISIAGMDSAAMVLQELVPVEIEEQGAALFGIAYPEGDPILRLQLPDGTILTEETTDDVNSGFIRNTGTVTESHEVAFMLNHVEPGIYTLIIDNAPAAYELVSYVLNQEPTLSDVTATCAGTPSGDVIVTCNGVGAGTEVNISWNADDSDSPEATVRVSYSQVLSDGVSLDSTNQTVVVEQLPLGAGNTVWNLGDVPTGIYKVVVSVDDGQHAPVETSAEVAINVTDQRAPAIPNGLRADPLPGELLVMWTPNVEKDIAGYEIGFGVVDSTQPNDPSRFVYSRDMGPKEVELPSGDVLDAKLWGLTDNQPVFVGIRAYDLSGNYSPWSPLLQSTPWPLSPVAWTPIPNGVSGESRAIEIVFDTPLVTETLPGALQLQAADGTPIPGEQELIFDVDGELIVGMRFVPSVPLTVDALYTAFVKGGEAGIATVDNRRLPVDYTWNFTASTAMVQSQMFMPILNR